MLVAFLFCNVLWLNRTDFVETLEWGFTLDVVFAMIIIYAMVVVLQSLLPFLILKILFHYAKKQMIKSLSFTEQEQVVLWDDYLSYAVVLEENQRIVDNIIRRRKKL